MSESVFCLLYSRWKTVCELSSISEFIKQWAKSTCMTYYFLRFWSAHLLDTLLSGHCEYATDSVGHMTATIWWMWYVWISFIVHTFILYWRNMFQTKCSTCDFWMQHWVFLTNACVHMNLCLISAYKSLCLSKFNINWLVVCLKCHFEPVCGYSHEYNILFPA